MKTAFGLFSVKILTEPPFRRGLQPVQQACKEAQLLHFASSLPTTLVPSCLPAFIHLQLSAAMAPKAEKKPAPAKKPVAKKSSAGRKKGSKKAVESYKIYIYKVIIMTIAGIYLCLIRVFLQPMYL